MHDSLYLTAQMFEDQQFKSKTKKFDPVCLDSCKIRFYKNSQQQKQSLSTESTTLILWWTMPTEMLCLAENVYLFEHFHATVFTKSHISAAKNRDFDLLVHMCAPTEWGEISKPKDTGEVIELC